MDDVHGALDAAFFAFGVNVPLPVSRIIVDYCRGTNLQLTRKVLR